MQITTPLTQTMAAIDTAERWWCTRVNTFGVDGDVAFVAEFIDKESPLKRRYTSDDFAAVHPDLGRHMLALTEHCDFNGVDGEKVRLNTSYLTLPKIEVPAAKELDYTASAPVVLASVSEITREQYGLSSFPGGVVIKISGYAYLLRRSVHHGVFVDGVRYKALQYSQPFMDFHFAGWEQRQVVGTELGLTGKELNAYMLQKCRPAPSDSLFGTMDFVAE